MTIESYVDELEIAAFLDTLHGRHLVVNDRIVERTDSAGRAIESMVRRHLAEVHGVPLDPRYDVGLVHLELQVGQDAAAAQHIEAWLKSPGVTTQDSITALSMAADAFVRRDVTSARIAMARQYVERLTTFPPQLARTALYSGRITMMRVFDGRGQSDSAATWGLRAYAMLNDWPYEQRAGALADALTLCALARNLVGLPHGRTRLDSLLTVLKRVAVLQPTEVAKDTLLRLFQQWQQPGIEKAFVMVSWYGKPMPPFVATHWLNSAPPATVSNAAPGARALKLDDGVIRIVGFGWFSCGGCQIALRNVQQSLGVLPKGVQVIFNERSEGTFNGNFAEPAEEAENLRKWYLERRQFTFPIAIWAPVKDSTPGGGALPRESPLWRALQISVGPTVYIVDGRGVIRFMGFGFDQPYDKMLQEAPLRRALEAVVHEREIRERETHERDAQDVHKAQIPAPAAHGALP